MSTGPPTRRERVRTGAVIAVAMALMNLSTYLFNVLASPLLGPREYGAVAAVLSVLTVVNVIALGLQATAARRVAAHPDSIAAIEVEMRRITFRASLWVTGLCLLAAPLLDRALRLDSLPTAILLAVAAGTLTMLGGQAGLLQGEGRWGPLALVYLGFGFGRLLAGAACMVLAPTAFGATLGMALGAFVPVAIGEVALRHPSRLADRDAAGQSPTEAAAAVSTYSGARVLREVVTNSHALLAFLCLSNIDMVIVRVTMTDHQSGLYAAGLIITKAVLFLPQFVIVLLFPEMSREAQRARTPWSGLGLIGGIGLLAVAGTYLLSRVTAPDGSVSLAVLFVGGKEYAEIGPQLWGWAALGMVLAMTQLLIYGVLATRNSAAISVVWTALALVVTCGPFLAGPTAMLTVVTLVDLVLLGTLTVISVVSSVGRLVPAPAGADTDVERDRE